ncbi:chemotaxis protein CheW [Bacillota bacterium]
MQQTDLLNQAGFDDEDTLKGKYLIFSMGKELFGIEIRYITEIIGMQPITEVPEMPTYVKGITNLRGKIIPVMDARLRFKKEEREYDSRTCIIVLETNETSIGLIVDSVAEVLNMKDEDISPAPEINKSGNNYIKGIGKSGNDVMLLLDSRRLLKDEELDAIGAIA